MTQLALVASGLFRRVHEFDRVFQRNDVDGLLLVDLIEQCRQRRCLAASRRAGQKPQSRLFLGYLRKDSGQPEARNARNLPLQFAQNDGEMSLLAENIDAEPGIGAERVTAIARS